MDYALTKDPATRPKFLDQLRNTLTHIGFLYISNPPISQHDTDAITDYLPKLFALPQEKKDKLTMRDSLHFLGYNGIGSEITKGKADQREQSTSVPHTKPDGRLGPPIISGYGETLK